jgi:hypothetical protein
MSPTAPGPDSSTQFLVAFLRNEADQAERRAQQLREQAAQLRAAHGITDEQIRRYQIPTDQLPPLDERGVPKYRGKKRGRKPRERKRRVNPARKKRQHTAYTLFVQESYPVAKAQHPGWPSKVLISHVAKQWAAVSVADKKKWKQRALATHEAEETAAEEEQEYEEEEELPEEEEEEEEEMAEEEEVEEDAKHAAQLDAAAASVIESEYVDEDEAPAPPARPRRNTTRQKDAPV